MYAEGFYAENIKFQDFSLGGYSVIATPLICDGGERDGRRGKLSELAERLNIFTSRASQFTTTAAISGRDHNKTSPRRRPRGGRTVQVNRKLIYSKVLAKAVGGGGKGGESDAKRSSFGVKVNGNV